MFFPNTRSAFPNEKGVASNWRFTKFSHSSFHILRNGLDDLKIPELQQNAFEWVGPIIFISASYYSQNPDAVNIALGLISSYLKDFFKGIPGNKKVKLSIVKEETKGKKYQRIDYEGDVSGLSELGDIIKSTKNE